MKFKLLFFVLCFPWLASSQRNQSLHLYPMPVLGDHRMFGVKESNNPLIYCIIDTSTQKIDTLLITDSGFDTCIVKGNVVTCIRRTTFGELERFSFDSGKPKPAYSYCRLPIKQLMTSAFPVGAKFDVYHSTLTAPDTAVSIKRVFYNDPLKEAIGVVERYEIKYLLDFEHHKIIELSSVSLPIDKE